MHPITQPTDSQPLQLTFRGFQTPPQLPDNYLDNTLDRLLNAVRTIQKQLHLEDSLEELYHACENLCQYQRDAVLYDALQGVLTAHVSYLFDQLEADLPEDSTVLTRVDTLWKEYVRQTQLIRGIFLYLDRTYVIKNAELPNLWELALDLFRQQWLAHAKVRNTVLRQLLATFEERRNGQSIDMSTLQDLVRMYVDLLIYPSGLEFSLLESTESYYRAESQHYLTNLDQLEETTRAQHVAEYLVHVESRLEQEKTMATQFLHKDTIKALMNTVSKELLESHVDQILQQGLEVLLRNCQMEHLERFYRLLARVHHLTQLRAAVGKYIENTGRAIVCAMDQDDTMVERLIQLKQQQDRVMAQCFRGDEQFLETFRSSFEHLMNARPAKPSQLLARYIDHVLRSAGKNITEEHLEQTMNQVLTLFRYLHEKDVFETFYKRDLARRLLHNKSVSLDAERTMLVKLKQECGADFTHRLEGMFRDIEVSKDLQAEFDPTPFRAGKQRGKRLAAESDATVAEHELRFHAKILTESYWPTYERKENVVLPKAVIYYQNQFEKFYLTKNQGRRMRWQDTLATCVVRVHFPLGMKELMMSGYQALILLVFTSNDSYTYRDIQNATEIHDDDELIRTLQSLACGKIPILVKEPPTKNVVPATDTFRFNLEFTSSLFRIRVNAVQLKDSPEETKVTTEKVIQDRQYQVDAATVRIMKSQKSLTHTQLLNTLFQTLQFPITAADLKKRIDILIDKDFIERDPDDSSLYRYLA
ncbi:Cullin-4A [Dispira simplex]|nr:Cullin-4A [Dispira simplex]